MYVCMYVCICTYACMHVGGYTLGMHACRWVCMHVGEYVYACACICVRVCARRWVHACMYMHAFPSCVCSHHEFIVLLHGVPTTCIHTSCTPRSHCPAAWCAYHVYSHLVHTSISLSCCSLDASSARSTCPELSLSIEEKMRRMRPSLTS